MLEKDYQSVIGRPIPYRKFGFSHSHDFFRSLKDVLQVAYRNNHLLLFGIADESTEHILKMVQKQKKPKFYNSLNSTSQKAAPKKRLNSTVFHPSALTRSGIVKVLKKYPKGFSILKLADYYLEVNGTKLDVKSSKELPSFILQMPDIAQLDYGKKEKSGNNLYVFPSKTLSGYQKLLENKLGSLSTSSCFTVAAVSTTTAVAASSSNTVQSWIDSLSCNATCSTTCSTVTSASSMSYKRYKAATLKASSSCASSSGNSYKALSDQKTCDGTVIQRFQKLSSETSSGVSSQASVSEVSLTASSSKIDSFILQKSIAVNSKTSATSDLDNLSVFEDETPPASSLLKQEIINLLHECRSEIRSIKLPSLYKNKYGKELDLHKHGYYSIIELMATMTDKVSMCRLSRTGDWLLKIRSSKLEKSKGEVTILVNLFMYLYQ